jgi:uncharacterized protein with ParB-like and HNH nuclease domain
MKADSVRFLEEFLVQSTGTQYVIPVYQRNYSWKKNDQVNNLLEDIDALLKNKEVNHFIGSIVYVPTTVLNSTERSVVDGQQRLTTLFLILYALKRIASENGEKDFADMMKNKYLENSFGNEKFKLRLKPLVSDDSVYEKIASDDLESLNNIREKSNVKENYDYIYDKLKEFNLNGHSLTDIQMAIDRLYIVYIQLEETDNAQEIFESINSTGLKLNAADLIRNFILMNKPNEAQTNIYTNYWQRFETIIPEPKKLEAFFRMFIGTRLYSLENKERIYSAFKKFWKQENGDKNEKEILDDLMIGVKNYSRLYVSKAEDDLGEELYLFRRLNYTTPAVFVLSVLELLSKGKLNNKQVKETLNIINIYFIRRLLSGKESNDISRTFPVILKNVINLAEKNNYVDFTEIVKTELLFKNLNNNAAMPTDSQITDYLKVASIYGTKYTRWILEQIEMDKSRVELQFDKLTIEHIMPQKKDHDWNQIMIDYSEDEYASIVNTLGNLTLASKGDNSEMGNKNFETKKRVLNNSSHIKMNKYVLECDKWNEEEIKKRGEIMTIKLLNLFPYIKSRSYTDEESNKIYIYIDKEIYAKGYLYDDNKVAVLKGSFIDMNKECTTYISKEREECLSEELIDIIDDNFVMVEDFVLNSPSAAASFVLGGNRNGHHIWVNENKIKLSSLK